MVRKKVYKKQHILAAAQDLLIEKGFSFITARNVADHMGISTQPIYLEFKNMEELKLTLLNTTYETLEKEFLLETKTSNNCANFGLNYIDLAKSNKKLYISLYIDHHSYGQELQQLLFDSFQKAILDDKNYATVSKEKLEKLHMNLWIVATGIASLSISGMLNQTEEQLITIFEAVEQNSGIR
ncbi:TetR/AcrR family transcriptional regulator [Enterococcus ureasiticus]|uniref:TetR/AcrR family transcriptional regulator n=1 Tax=Enterococcus ureasiticus TaxID=903984 RepID=UPI001A9002B3|nr:TetR/AcrR family transcriptional regulator [Enterococcus ureasiticus]MBO0472691.1 TetR/AcrR family transcriptional regulator [Enterococcus ureasiticus]